MPPKLLSKSRRERPALRGGEGRSWAAATSEGHRQLSKPYYLIIAIMVLLQLLHPFLKITIEIGAPTGNSSKKFTMGGGGGGGHHWLLLPSSREKSISPQQILQPQNATTMSKGFPQLNVRVRGNERMLQPIWDGSPIVMESHKLLFLTTPKVSCTVFKQLFRRMMGYKDWQSQLWTLPHNPAKNGLKYLAHYAKTPHQIQHMLNDPEWTFAVFVRDPKERMLSAFMDKAAANTNWYLQQHCCGGQGQGGSSNTKVTVGCAKNYSHIQPQSRTVMSFDVWLKEFVPNCAQDPHWRPQINQLPYHMWPAVDFIGHMDNLYHDTRQLLERVRSTKTNLSIWEEFGATGWGPDGNYSMYDPRLTSSVSHRTNAKDSIEAAYTPELDAFVRQFYQEDYNYRPFGFTA